MKNKPLIFFLFILFFILIYLVISNFFASKKNIIIISELREDLKENYLNYIDKPSWLVKQALRLIIPPLIDYQGNCYPYSKILNQVPTLDNKMMFTINKQTVIILNQDNFLVKTIKPLDIISTFQILNMENISDRWVFRNLVESVDKIEVTKNGVNIQYKITYSLPYFPCPVIFNDPNIYKEQVLNFTYKDIKNFSIFPSYSDYKIKQSQTNHFLIQNKKNKQQILFKTYTNVEKLKRELKKSDIVKIPSNLRSYFENNLPDDHQIITLPHKEMYFIFFNPSLKKELRLFLFHKIKEELLRYKLDTYILNNTYILPYHFASKKLVSEENKFPNNLSTKRCKTLLTYKDSKSKIFASLLQEIIKREITQDILLINIEEKAPKKEIFGTLVEPPELPLKQVINPYEFDFVITSITFLPYMNYYDIYSKDGKYNVYSVSNKEIENFLNEVMSGFSENQKDYLIALQEELWKEFLILPLAIDTQTFIVKQEILNEIKINPINIEFYDK